MIFIRRQPLPFYTASSSSPYSAWQEAHHLCPKETTDETKKTAPQEAHQEAKTMEKKSDRNKDNLRVVYRGVNAQMIEENGNLSILIDLPGVKPSDVSIELESNVMQVEAKRMSGSTVISKYLQSFFVDGKSVDLTGVTASMADGVLTIEAPKKPTTEPVTVQVVSEYPPKSDKESLVVLSLDVPGVKIDNLKVDYHDDAIAVQGERTRGRFTTKIQRSYSFDENRILVGSLKAYLVNGVLTVIALANEKTKNEKISISVTTDSMQRNKGELAVVETGEEEDEATARKSSNDEVLVETVEEDEATTRMGNLQSDGKDKEWERVE